LQPIDLAFSTLKSMNISLSPTKTEIGASEIEFMGYKLSGDSVRMTDKHIQAIGKISSPKNVKVLQRILGMVNYWKKTYSAQL